MVAAANPPHARLEEYVRERLPACESGDHLPTQDTITGHDVPHGGVVGFFARVGDQESATLGGREARPLDRVVVTAVHPNHHGAQVLDPPRPV